MGTQTITLLLTTPSSTQPQHPAIASIYAGIALATEVMKNSALRFETGAGVGMPDQSDRYEDWNGQLDLFFESIPHDPASTHTQFEEIKAKLSPTELTIDEALIYARCFLGLATTSEDPSYVQEKCDRALGYLKFVADKANQVLEVERGFILYNRICSISRQLVQMVSKQDLQLADEKFHKKAQDLSKACASQVQKLSDSIPLAETFREEISKVQKFTELENLWDRLLAFLAQTYAWNIHCCISEKKGLLEELKNALNEFKKKYRASIYEPLAEIKYALKVIQRVEDWQKILDHCEAYKTQVQKLPASFPSEETLRAEILNAQGFTQLDDLRHRLFELLGQMDTWNNDYHVFEKKGVTDVVKNAFIQLKNKYPEPSGLTEIHYALGFIQQMQDQLPGSIPPSRINTPLNNAPPAKEPSPEIKEVDVSDLPTKIPSHSLSYLWISVLAISILAGLVLTFIETPSLRNRRIIPLQIS